MADANKPKHPKVFISYSWSSDEHRTQVREWAERLQAEGIEIIMDVFDLEPGHDRYKFMERMVTDKTVTHVLMFCDQQYTKKANEREKPTGVGAECQIITGELYEKTEQVKFIPIYCEAANGSGFYVPAFLKPRYGIDFSTLEKVNENWEKLIRVLFEKPLYTKPSLGTPPVYITDEIQKESTEIAQKWRVLKNGLLTDAAGVPLYREDFLKSCYCEIDKLRLQDKDVSSTQEELLTKIKNTIISLHPIRNDLIEWILVEGKLTKEEDVFSKQIINMLKEILSLKSKHPKLTRWDKSWLTPHGEFVYEMFLYTVAALLKLEKHHTLYIVFTEWYEDKSARNYRQEEFDSFRCFWTPTSEILQDFLNVKEGYKYENTISELVQRSADRPNLPFTSLQEAELIIMLMVLIAPEVNTYWHWYPHLLSVFGTSIERGFFLKAKQRRFFKNLATIAGVNDGNQLRQLIAEKQAGLNHSTNIFNRLETINRFIGFMNLEELDTV